MTYLVKKVTQWKCILCNTNYDTHRKARICLTKCKRIEAFDKKYPEVKEKRCDFANSGYVERTKTWYDSFVKDLETLIIKNHPSLKNDVKTSLHGFLGRILDDSGFREYGHWIRLNSICRTCYREWGQGYLRVNCQHNGTYRGRSGIEVGIKFKVPPVANKFINPSRRKP